MWSLPASVAKPLKGGLVGKWLLWSCSDCICLFAARFGDKGDIVLTKGGSLATLDG